MHWHFLWYFFRFPAVNDSCFLFSFKETRKICKIVLEHFSSKMLLAGGIRTHFFEGCQCLAQNWQGKKSSYKGLKSPKIGNHPISHFPLFHRELLLSAALAFKMTALPLPGSPLFHYSKGEKRKAVSEGTASGSSLLLLQPSQLPPSLPRQPFPSL